MSALQLEIIRHDAHDGKIIDSLPLHVAAKHVADNCYTWDTGDEYKAAVRKAKQALRNKAIFRIGGYIYANRQLFNIAAHTEGGR